MIKVVGLGIGFYKEPLLAGTAQLGSILLQHYQRLPWVKPGIAMGNMEAHFIFKQSVAWTVLSPRLAGLRSVWAGSKPA